MRKNRIVISFWFLLLAVPIVTVAQEDSVRRKRMNDIKITLLSIGSGSTRITYERAFTPQTSAEWTIGIIGLGVDWLHHTRSRGILLKFAYKWNLVPMRRANSPLAGFYLKPELVVANFNYAPKKDPISSDVNRYPKHTLQGAVLGEFGYQLLLKWFVFDVYAGLGPTFGNGNDMNYYHGFMRLPKDGWLSYTSGFRLGVAF